MCDQPFSEAHALGLCNADFPEGRTGDGAPAYLKYRGTARLRQTGPKVTQVDHSDGRASATVRPETFNVKVSMATGKRVPE